MPAALKIKRAGLGVKTYRKVPFREWLNEQPRKELTYRKDIENRDGVGWKTEDFIEEARKRGIDLRIGTAFKWASGSVPRWLTLNQLKKAFPTTRF